MYGTEDHPLTKWRNAQEPPWPVSYLAKKLGTSMPWLSTITSSNPHGKRCSPEIAYAIEVITSGAVTMRDMLLSEQAQRDIEKRIRNGS